MLPWVQHLSSGTTIMHNNDCGVLRILITHSTFPYCDARKQASFVKTKLKTGSIQRNRRITAGNYSKGKRTVSGAIGTRQGEGETAPRTHLDSHHFPPFSLTVFLRIRRFS